MDEIDERLGEAGKRWRAAQPPPVAIDPASLGRSIDRGGPMRVLASFAAGAALVLATAAIVTQSGIWAQGEPRTGMAPTAEARPSAATSDAGCAVTRPDPAFAAPSPYPSSPPDDRYAWFGTPQLWTMLELDGEIWDAANSPFPLGIKIFWWSSNWAGMRAEQEPDITVVATRLDGPGAVATDHGTNAYADSLGGEAMLAGIEFPTPGCWQVTALYRGAVLSYVLWITDE